MCLWIVFLVHGLMDVLIDCVPGGWIDGCAHVLMDVLMD
jgi:hypothetical protein